MSGHAVITTECPFLFFGYLRSDYDMPYAYRMSFKEVALGLASLAVGLNSLKKGFGHLSAAQAPQRNPRFSADFGGFADGPGRPAPRRPARMPGTPFANTGYRTVQASNGARVPMQMRSFNIKTLDDRIAYLRRLVDAGKREPQVYAFTRRAVSRRCGEKWCVPEKDNLAEAKAIFGAMRNPNSPDLVAARKLFRSIRGNVRYTSDIAGVDTYQKASHTLALRTGDCDDYSTLTCSALQSIGIPCRFKVIRTKGANDWNHIFPQAGFPRLNPTKWVSMDSSINMPFGWEAPPRMVADSRVFRVG